MRIKIIWIAVSSFIIHQGIVFADEIVGTQLDPSVIADTIPLKQAEQTSQVATDVQHMAAVLAAAETPAALTGDMAGVDGSLSIMDEASDISIRDSIRDPSRTDSQAIYLVYDGTTWAGRVDQMPTVGGFEISSFTVAYYSDTQWTCTFRFRGGGSGLIDANGNVFIWDSDNRRYEPAGVRMQLGDEEIGRITVSPIGPLRDRKPGDIIHLDFYSGDGTRLVLDLLPV